MRHFLRKWAVKRILGTRNCETKVTWPRQVLSAIQPTGKIHLGNYLGAVKKWVELQRTEKNAVVFGIADLHSITFPQDPQELHDNILMTAATLLACGIDAEKCILFQQSTVPQHTQLCWMISTMTTMARLAHLPQYKEKSKGIKEIPIGIFLYPMLQAADVMLYKATHVPVGEDQLQHIILVNHTLRLFNNRFGETFPKVDAMIDDTAGRIKSLGDPSKKMSKSDKNTKSTISLLDTPDEILFKCKKAMTDCTSKITYDPDKRPGVANLLQIHSGITGKSPSQIVEESSHLDTAKYKLVLAEAIIEHVKPISSKILEYLNAPEYLVSTLESGSTRAREIAERTMKEVEDKMGFNVRHSQWRRRESSQVG